MATLIWGVQNKQNISKSKKHIKFWKGLLAHLSLKYTGLPSSVCVSGCVSVDIFKLEYLHNQWANRKEILTVPSLGWGKGCIRFWARSDRNSGVHGNG